jgi:hypothetical protein
MGDGGLIRRAAAPTSPAEMAALTTAEDHQRHRFLREHELPLAKLPVWKRSTRHEGWCSTAI